MFGFLEESRAVRERTVRLEQQTLRGLTFCVAKIPVRPRGREKCLRRAARLLKREGVREMLLPPGSEYWTVLREEGLKDVETVELCRAAAAPLTLDVLRLRGWEIKRAVVVLSEKTAGRYLLRAAELLVGHVYRLIFDVPDGGEKLAEYMCKQYGMPIVPPGKLRPSLTVAFDHSGRGKGVTLSLFGGRPDLLGSKIWAEGAEIPEGMDSLSVLAAMRERGILHDSALRAGEKHDCPMRVPTVYGNDRQVGRRRGEKEVSLDI